ncbi:MAG: hypothetical protein ACYTGW_17225 [Planctomycetota bacterium]
MKIGRYLARRFALSCLLVLGAIAAVIAGLWGVLPPAPSSPQAPSSLPAPWSLGVVTVWLAATLTWWRCRSLGELHLLHATGVYPLRAAVPTLLVAALLQLLLAVPAGHMPATAARRGVQVIEGTRGELLLLQDRRWVLLDQHGSVTVLPLAAALPTSFVPAPRSRARYRRQAFFVAAPRPWARNNLDPWLLRWFWLLAGVAGSGLILTSHRFWPQLLALPLLALLALLL